MTAARRLHTKTFFFLAVMVLAGACGDVLLGRGMKQVGEIAAWTPSAAMEFLLGAFTNPIVWAGILCLIGYFVAYALVLSWADFSYVLPASALTYVLVPLLARFFLQEQVNTLRWAGVACIFFGVALVGSTPPNTTAAHGDTSPETR
ncbi:MAG TPA: EamA family transporter [Candidatus Nitrosotenuis sp.]|nr:EamA family transporter [Candidatus Nitrosotenuis sp.]